MYPSNETLDRLRRQRQELEDEMRREYIAIAKAITEKNPAAPFETMPLPPPEAPWSDPNPTPIRGYSRRNPSASPRTRQIRRCADALERIADALGPKKSPAAPPPIGVQPNYSWTASRIHDVMCAISRYKAAGLDPLPEWLAELEELKKERYP